MSAKVVDPSAGEPNGNEWLDSNATVYVVEDNDGMRQSIENILNNANFRTRVFRSPREFLDHHSEGMAGCLVLDFQLQEMDGLELHDRLIERNCDLPFIVISGFASVSRVLQSFRKGAVDFLEKPFSRAQLLDRVHHAMRLDATARAQRQCKAELTRRLESLTPREAEVMRLLAEGREAKQIAKDLGISPKTAHNHRAKVLEKMGVDNVPKLLRLLHDAE